MRKFRGIISIGLVGCKREYEFEVEDHATEDDIEEASWETALEYMNTWYEEL